MILSQFVRSDGCMLPRRVTGLCKIQQKRVSTMVTMAHKAGKNKVLYYYNFQTLTTLHSLKHIPYKKHYHKLSINLYMYKHKANIWY